MTSQLTQLVLTATTLGGLAILWMYLYNKKRKSLPTKWERVGKVKNLYVYPLKSGHRIELTTGICTEFGIQSNEMLRDRCLVVYKEADREFRTARTHPKLVLVEVTAKDGRYLLSGPGMDPLWVEIPSNQTGKVFGWSHEELFTIDCGDEAAQWLSKYILDAPSGLRLGYHDGLAANRRTMKSFPNFTKVYPYFKDEAMGVYSDMASYMVMNQASVDELVSRLPEEDIDVHNFRPTILVEGDDLGPYDEDKWEWIKVGEVVLRVTKPCARCAFTTINAHTGTRNQNNEPLKTLKTYRKVKDLLNVDLEGESPIMGLYMGLVKSGRVNVGDEVFVGTR